MDQDSIWHGGRHERRPHCLRWGPSSPSPKRGHIPPIFGPCLLWPNGWMDHDGTWNGGRPRPRPQCIRWGPSSPQLKRSTAPPPLLAHVYCSQTAGWIKMPLGTKVGLRAGQHCVRCGPALPPQGTQPPNFRPVCCGQTAGWIKMPLGTKVGLDPCHIVLHGDLAPPGKGAQTPSPNFRPMSIVAKRSPISATAEHLLVSNKQN